MESQKGHEVIGEHRDVFDKLQDTFGNKAVLYRDCNFKDE